MKHRAPAAPGPVRRAAATVLHRAADRPARHVPRHASPERARRAGRGTPRHAAGPAPRPPAGLGLGVVATVATLGAIPAITAGSGDTAPPADAAGPTTTRADPPAEAAPAGEVAEAAQTAAKRAAVADAAAERAAAALGRVSRQAARPTPTPTPTPPPTPTRKKPAWVHPMPGANLTSCFGPRWGVLHAGLDLAAPAGTAVRAVGAGTVVSAGWSHQGYGISVLVDHGNGYLTHYAHLSRATVRPGQRVAAGTTVGREGSTGDSTGPHLHFEVHKGQWRQVDPAGWLRARGVRSGC